MSYPEKKIGEIAEVGAGSSAPQDKKYFLNGTVPFFRTSDVGKVHLSNNLNIAGDLLNRDAIRDLKIKIYPRHTILFPKSGASTFLNHRVMIGTEGAVSSHLATIVARENILQAFLFYFLLRVDAKKLTADQNYPSLRVSDIQNIKIPLPPLATQKQIVGRLDKIAEARKLNDELIQKSDELFQSLLHKELNPAGKNWEVKKLSEVGEIVTGTTPSTKKSEYWKGEFLWATPTDIKENTFILTDTPKKLSREGYEKTRPVPKNAILVTCIASIGKMTIAGKEMATNQQINSIVCNEENDPFFVFFSLQKDKKKLISLGKTTAVPIINKSEFGRIKISLPPLVTQKQIVAKLSAVQEYKTQLLAQKSKLKELFNSALAKSFNG